jgi:hypothetical protein
MLLFSQFFDQFEEARMRAIDQLVQTIVPRLDLILCPGIYQNWKKSSPLDNQGFLKCKESSPLRIRDSLMMRNPHH